MSSFQCVEIEGFHVYRGIFISVVWNKGVPLYTEVSSFQGVGMYTEVPEGVGIEEFQLSAIIVQPQ